MANIPLTWKLGIDQVSDETDLPDGAVRDCVNVDINRAATLDTRSGYTLKQAGNAHSLWTSVTGRSFFVLNGTLGETTYDGSSLSISPLHPMRENTALSYDDLTDGVVSGNSAELLRIDTSVRALGVEDPTAPGVTPFTSMGGLSAGRYGVVVTFVRGNEESAASPLALVDLTEGEGLNVTLPQPSASDVTAIRVYRTQPNGDVLYRAYDAPVGIASAVVGFGQLGRQCDTRFMQQLPGGQIVRYWRGRVLVARGRNLLFSESMRYGLWTPTDNFVQFPHRIRVMQPVEGGVFVGTKDGVVFLSGESPEAWVQRRTGGLPVVEGSGINVAASMLGGDRNYGGAYVAAWLAQNGFVLGTADGSLVEPQSKRISLPDSQLAAGVGASVVHERRIITSIN